MLRGETVNVVERIVGTLAELQGLVSEMEQKGWVLEKVEGNDTDGFYAVFVRVGQ